jgi:hypothetical protein
MSTVNDLDVARRAAQRGFITPEQLREARQFAAGGRSVLSVLLDLGHLKPDDLLSLGDPPPRPRVIRVFWLATIAAGGVAVLGALFLLASPVPLAPQVVAYTADLSVPPAPPPVSLADRALAILKSVETSLDASGRPPADRLGDLRRAAALLEEALPERDAPEDVLALARARELLDEWEGARSLYCRILKENGKDQPALLGAARTCLLLRDAESSRAYANKACALPPPSAEALFARGAAGMALGQDAAAVVDFSQACRLDASFNARVNALLSRRNGFR